MNGMAAGHLVTRIPRTEQVFLTDGTVRHVFAGLAVVIFKESRIDTHAAVMTVSKVFSSAHTAETTIGTVVGLFIVRHPQVANDTVVRSKLGTARRTKVGLARLSCVTQSTDDFRDCKTINLVMRLFVVVVRER